MSRFFHDCTLWWTRVWIYFRNLWFPYNLIWQHFHFPSVFAHRASIITQAGNLQLGHSFRQHAASIEKDWEVCSCVTTKALTAKWFVLWKLSSIVLTIIGLGMIAITIRDLGHHSLAAAVAAAARLSFCQQLCDSQPGCCVSSPAVPGLGGSEKRRERG